MTSTIKEKHFDCIEIKNNIQKQVYNETKNMNTVELLQYFNNTKSNNKKAIFY